MQEIKILTKEELLKLNYGDIFRKGTFIDGFEECNIANTGQRLRWVAVRGQIEDWAIYCQNPYFDENWDWHRIARHGDKIYNEHVIKYLVPCDEDSFYLYRY